MQDPKLHETKHIANPDSIAIALEKQYMQYNFIRKNILLARLE